MHSAEFKLRHSGETAFILGNGPSLAGIDLEALRRYGQVFGTNRIYLSGFTPDYYVAVNPLLLEQFGPEISKLECTKFLGQNTNLVGYGPVIQLDTSAPYEAGFGLDIEKPLWEGGTVTFICLQIAYYMGFSRVILLGVDHDYQGIGDANPHQVVENDGPDMNHFDPSYFGPGVRWNAPDLATSEVAYALARNAYGAQGKEIINASATTRLRVFPVVPLNTFLGSSPPLVSAIVSAYHAEKYIEGCLIDLAEQTLWKMDSLEVVIVCQSGSVELKKAFEFHKFTKPNRVVIVTTGDVPTVYRAWNLGLQAASAPLITNANTDDRHHPRAYEIAAFTLAGHPEIDLVYYNSFITWKDETYREFVSRTPEVIVNIREEGRDGLWMWGPYSHALLADGCNIGPHPMWRANLHQRFGLFNESYKSAGDYEFWLRIARERNMLNIPFPLGLYRARLDGVELRDLSLNAIESSQAITVRASTSGLEFSPFDYSLVRAKIADRWGLLSRPDLEKMKQAIEEFLS